jgi:hypothetical protein
MLGRVLAIALGALVLAVGGFSLEGRIAVGATVVLFLGYKVFREHQGFRFELVKENLLHLFPGHLLLLLALALQDNFSADSLILLIVWIGVVAATVLLDWAANALGGERWGVLASLYCLVFGGIFYLIREILVRSDKVAIQSDVVSMIVGIVGAIYLALAVYRFYKVRPAAS